MRVEAVFVVVTVLTFFGFAACGDRPVDNPTPLTSGPAGQTAFTPDQVTRDRTDGVSSATNTRTPGEVAFIGGRKLDLCNGMLNVCKGHTAGCVLDENHYIEGTFPGERKFQVRTSQGDWKIKVLLFLKDRLSAGTETKFAWYEPGCTDEYGWQISKNKMAGDLFEQAGWDQVFEVENNVVEAGDHLVTLWSDAMCGYLLRIEVVPQD